MNTINISQNNARNFALQSVLLINRQNNFSGKKGVLNIIDHLGFIQIDPLSVVKRAHHHTLWSRLPDYKTQTIYDLQAKDRSIFEYWGHAQCYFPISNYHFCLPRMRNFDNPQSPWSTYLLKNFGYLMKPFHEKIKSDGPQTPKDFSSQYGSHETKGALDLLFWKGDIMVKERQKFQKVFDLTERVLPDHVRTTLPDENETAEFLIRRCLQSMGLATKKEIQLYMQPESSRDAHMLAVDKKIVAKKLAEFIDVGKIIQITLQNDEIKDYFIFADKFADLEKTNKSDKSVWLLSPFDNLMTQRNRIKTLFNFDYTLESYLPAAKRKYGYFCLPILWGDQFVGRLDPKVDRERNTLIINNLIFEQDFNSYEKFLPRFLEILKKFVRFNDCEKIDVLNVMPGKVKPEIKII